MEEEARTWMQSRPKTVQELMLKFPPGCKVMAVGKVLKCPAPNKVARVVSYYEDGSLCVHPEDDPEHDTRYQVQQDWIRVVGFFTNEEGELQDREWVRKALEER